MTHFLEPIAGRQLPARQAAARRDPKWSLARRRDAEVSMMYWDGDPATVIAQELGVTPQTVYRRLERAGVRRRKRGRVSTWTKLLEAVRDPDVFTMNVAAERVGIHYESAYRLAAQHGKGETLQRLFTWRRSAARRRERLAELRALGEQLGRPPRLKEVNASPLTRSHMSYVWAFGSFKAAMRAAFPDHPFPKTRGRARD